METSLCEGDNMSERLRYKNAFNCKKCPMRNDEEGCPMWWEIPWENQETGEIKMQKGCILSQRIGLPIVQSIVRAAHVASEHTSKMRNDFYKSVGLLIACAQKGLCIEGEEPKQIEEHGSS